MPSIKVLPDNLINKIAAGEVVERPASVVKELIENSLDAGATEVSVEIEQAGKRLIRIVDNGSGMSREDAVLAFERHATSKISSEADLDAIRTMGFRGEALASIASVARVRLLTAQRGSASGVLVETDGGVMKPVADAASPPGTTIEVNHLFFNTPARLKFLKSPSTELSHIIAAVSHQALARPDVRFRLTHDKKTVLDLPAAKGMHERAFQIFGRELSDHLTTFSAERSPARVFGLIGRPNYDRGDRTYQEFYVNGRYVRNASLAHALAEGYRDLVMRDRYPVGFLFIEMDPTLVDVNVHPAKLEVRFRNQSQVHDLVHDAVREALRGARGVGAVPGPDRVKDAVTDYLKGADLGARSGRGLEFGVRSGASAEFSSQNAEAAPLSISALGYHDIHPELSTLNSELLVPLAQVQDSFIVAQDNDGMALIDQHAAHERVLFEKLQDQHVAGTIRVQDLLIPVQVELGHADTEFLKEFLPELNRLGFFVDAFSGTTFVIKGVPALMTGGDYKRLLLDILDELRVHGKSRKIDAVRDEVLSVMACHPAIKVHRRLSIPEMERLISDLFSCRMPHSCPHGRPTVVRFSMNEIKKMFKRI
jgi:DNA mismatch repair protein MutL